ncbi:peptidoglycan DD-metalloendopeptidase family protein [Vibrio sp. RC27]
MKNRVIVSVRSESGIQRFHFAKPTFRFIKFSILGLVIGSVCAAGVIYQLNHEVTIAKSKQNELQVQSTSLLQEVESLSELKQELESDVSNREEQMLQVADRLEDLERLLGVIDPDVELISRLDTASITSQMRTMMLNQIPSGAPVINAPISSGYGKRIHPITGKVKIHRGQDFAVNTGTPIYAPADGVIEAARASNKGSGNFLRIQHSYGFTSSYSHLSKFAVKYGDFVSKGDLIGYSGNSGLSSGPHLHYEVRFVGKPLNPRPFVDWNVSNFEEIFTKVKGIKWDALVAGIESRVSNQLQLSSKDRKSKFVPES